VRSSAIADSWVLKKKDFSNIFLNQKPPSFDRRGAFFYTLFLKASTCIFSSFAVAITAIDGTVAIGLKG